MHTRNVTIGRQSLSIETGRLAKQADGAVIVRSGDTMVLVTACAAASHTLSAMRMIWPKMDNVELRKF